MKQRSDIVSATEIAAWAWCPEAWRLRALGNEPENHAALRRGEVRHARKSAFERWSRVLIALGWWLVVAAALMAAVAFALGKL